MCFKQIVECRYCRFLVTVMCLLSEGELLRVEVRDNPHVLQSAAAAAASPPAHPPASLRSAVTPHTRVCR